jgi:hypothetical protein
MLHWPELILAVVIIGQSWHGPLFTLARVEMGRSVQWTEITFVTVDTNPS